MEEGGFGVVKSSVCLTRRPMSIAMRDRTREILVCQPQSVDKISGYSDIAYSVMQWGSWRRVSIGGY